MATQSQTEQCLVMQMPIHELVNYMDGDDLFNQLYSLRDEILPSVPVIKSAGCIEEAPIYIYIYISYKLT